MEEGAGSDCTRSTKHQRDCVLGRNMLSIINTWPIQLLGTSTGVKSRAEPGKRVI